jgi:hypothetical protein
MRESEQARRDHDAERYARGELRGAAAAAFERRLGAEQAARDALCSAVRRAAEWDGREPPRPDPAYRRHVLRRLRPRRAGRGRPAAWALAGAAAAAAVLLLLTARPAPPSAAPAPPAPAVAGETPAVLAPSPDGPAIVNAGEARPDLNPGDPSRTRTDEDHRLVRDDEHPSPLQPPSPMKH